MLCATVNFRSLEVKFIQTEWEAMVGQSGADAEAQALTCGATVFPPQKAETPASKTATLPEMGHKSGAD